MVRDFLAGRFGVDAVALLCTIGALALGETSRQSWRHETGRQGGRARAMRKLSGEQGGKSAVT
jgi:hypothetical protein